jgi:hypothetical protein
MIIFLPERVYEEVKNDGEFIAINGELVNYVHVSNTSFEDHLNKTTNWPGTNLPQRYMSLVKSKVNEVYQREIDIMEDTGETSLLKRLESETDVENILMIYYKLIDVYITNAIKNAEFRKKYTDLVEQHKGRQFSTRVWVKYSQYKAKEKVGQYLFDNPTEDELMGIFNEYMVYLDSLIAEIPNSDTDYVHNILQHKKLDEIQNILSTMLVNYSQRDTLSLFMDLVLRTVNSIEFKYKLFNLYTLRIMKDVFFHYFFVRDFENCKASLTRIVQYINWALNNKEYAIKSLSHHNLILISNFVEEVGFFSRLLSCFPDFPENLVMTYPFNSRFYELSEETLSILNDYFKENVT